MISGGYYIKARKIQESEIQHAPPHVREIWDWLIKEVNHSDTQTFKRGTTFKSLQDIREGLHWYVGYRKEMYSKSKCEMSMKWLRKRTMVTTTKTTRGLIITICNYDYYQDPKNYETNDENGKKETRSKQHFPTIIEEGEEREEGKETSSDADEKVKIPIRDKKITPGQFDRFWKLYPGKKTDKGKCLSKWKTICGREGNERPTWGEISTAIHQQLKTERWQDKKFIPYPHTWLNQRRWLDDPVEMVLSHRNNDSDRIRKGGAVTPKGHFDDVKSEILEL